MTLSKHHAMMVADGFPAALILTREQRDAVWRANPPKAVSWSTIESQENRAREAALRKAAAELAEEQQPLTKKAPQVEDHTGMKWSTKTARWIPDPTYKPEPAKKKAKKAPAEKDLSKVLEHFKVQEGTNKRRCLYLLLGHQESPISAEALAKEVYGEDGKVGALAGVLKGVQVAIEKYRLPWVLEKTEKGYQLHED